MRMLQKEDALRNLFMAGDIYQIRIEDETWRVRGYSDEEGTVFLEYLDGDGDPTGDERQVALTSLAKSPTLRCYKLMEALV